jgi:hypothetical protein
MTTNSASADELSVAELDGVAGGFLPLVAGAAGLATAAATGVLVVAACVGTAYATVKIYEAVSGNKVIT